MSSIGWIDFSSTDRERVNGVLALLSEAGTLDELGIGQLRDAFSDTLFPGFSTVQTRAKYFVTVPQIFADYWALTPKERRKRSLESYLKESEDHLAERLVSNHEDAQRVQGEPFPVGIIGKERVSFAAAIVGLLDRPAQIRSYQNRAVNYRILPQRWQSANGRTPAVQRRRNRQQ